ncbi:MAG: hypothetical protein H0U74_15575 [Bradymonadaceae bacterium]|nr:hypothetical protein [Lujinxingiaceae bacterium]
MSEALIRVLIIGRPASVWAQRLGEAVGEGLELDVARLPSAGIRQLELTPPDLIVIADDAGGQRVETLVAAIRNRPIGQLLPLILLCPQPSAAEVVEKIEALELAGWLPVEASSREMVRLIEKSLDVALSADLAPKAALPAGSVNRDPTIESPRPSLGAQGAPEPSAHYLLEPLEEPERGPLVERRSMFPSRQTSGFDEGLDAETILRKLKSVRHEDYYAVLEIRRGAESQTVREAFHRLYARFDPQALEFELSHRYQTELSEIRDALEDAWAVLGDPDLRDPYLAHTVRK